MTMTPAERRAGITVAITCVAAAALAFGLTMPLLGLLLENEGYSRTMIGLNAAMAPLAIMVSAPFMPRIVARFGAKNVIITAAFTDAVLLVLLKLTNDYYAWLPLRFLMGMMVSALFVTSESWINEVTENHNRGKIMAIYNITLSAGFAAGPLLVLLVGTSGWAPFASGAAVMALAALPMVMTRAANPPFEGTAGFNVLSYFVIAPTLAGAMLLFAMVENGSTSLLAVYGRRSGLADTDAVTLISAVVFGGMVLAWPVGWLADRMNRMRLMLILAVITTAFALLIPGTIEDPILRIVVLFLWGGAAMSIYTLAMAIQGERFKGADLVTANAAFGTIYGMGSLAGPVLFGISMDYHDPHGFAYAVIAVCAIFMVFAAARQAFKN